MSNQASCLIKTRLYHIGFPERFQYFPEGMDTDTLNRVHAAALEMMRYPSDISTPDRLERCIFTVDSYLVLGIAGFLKYLLPERSVEYNGFCDASNIRKIYGFFAFVWDVSHPEGLPRTFPSAASFAALASEMILPHWEKMDYSLQGEAMSRGIAERFRFEAPDAEDPGEAVIALNANPGQCAVHYADDATGALNAALNHIVRSGAGSIRTATRSILGDDTVFDNWIVPGRAQAQPELRPKIKKTQVRQPEKPPVPSTEPTGGGENPAQRRRTESGDRENSVSAQIILDFYSSAPDVIVDDWEAEEMEEEKWEAVSTLVKRIIHTPNGWSVESYSDGIRMFARANPGEWEPGMEEDILNRIAKDIASKQRDGLLPFVALDRTMCRIIPEPQPSNFLDVMANFLEGGVETLKEFPGRIADHFERHFTPDREQGGASRPRKKPGTDEKKPLGVGMQKIQFPESPKNPGNEKKIVQRPTRDGIKEDPFDI